MLALARSPKAPLSGLIFLWSMFANCVKIWVQSSPESSKDLKLMETHSNSCIASYQSADLHSKKDFFVSSATDMHRGGRILGCEIYLDPLHLLVVSEKFTKTANICFLCIA